jgi:hypothetical protein
MPDRIRNLQIVCGAVALGLVLVNAVLGLLLARGLAPVPIPQIVSIVLFAAGVALLVAAPAVKGAVYKRADAEGIQGDPGKVFAAYRKATLMAFALREAGGLIGFVLSILTGNPWWSWGLGGAAVIAMLFDWPKREPLEL